MDHHLNDTAERIARLACRLDRGFHFCGKGRIRTANRIGFDILNLHRRSIYIGAKAMNLSDEANDFNPVHLFKPLLCNGSCCDPTDGLPSTCAPAALPVPDPVLHLVGVIGM